MRRCLHGGACSRQTYELGGPQIYRLREIVGLVAKLTGRRRWIVGLPDAPGAIPGADHGLRAGPAFLQRQLPLADHRQRLLRGRLCEARHQAAVDGGVRQPVFGRARGQCPPQPRPRESPAAPRPSGPRSCAKQPCIDCASPICSFSATCRIKLTAKTAFGLKDWCPEDVAGEWSLPGCGVTLGLERLSPQQAPRRGAGSIIVGIAPTGGKLPPHWIAELDGGGRGRLGRRERAAHPPDLFPRTGAGRLQTRRAAHRCAAQRHGLCRPPAAANAAASGY